ncbi:MAG: FAD-dependent oxidoreductase [Geminicoccaceae bacterium]|nr:FAD-dependent oxidoreductase [Geminicoccaceae bacterium]
MTDFTPDLCIVGAGSAGLSLAAGAAGVGAEVVLIEKGAMGGDCLNVGCVPSKSLIAAGRRAAAMRASAPFGIAAVKPAIDADAVRAHVRDVIAGIAPNDSVERFEGLGVRVIKAAARFTGPDTLEAGGHTVRARRFALATGSRPVAPPIPGLDAVPYLTNETVFDVAPAFDRLLVVGGGAIGCELAQACRRLGAGVTLVEMGKILAKDDPELVAYVRARMAAEGVDLIEDAKVKRVEAGPALVVEAGDGERRVAGSHLLVATGRRPVTDGLGLEAAGIAFGKGGIEVDAHLRTSNRRVYAIGDCKGPPMFTHAAGHEAGVVLQNALFRLWAKPANASTPHVTFTDPELAQVGLTEAEAKERHGEGVRVLRWSFSDNDRARAERLEGLAKIVLDKKGNVVGAGIAGEGAGDLLVPWQLVMAGKADLKDLARLVVPYPTLSEVSKRAAGSFYAPKLFGTWSRRAVSLLKRLP